MVIQTTMIKVDRELHKLLKFESKRSSEAAGRHVSIREWLVYALDERLKSLDEIDRLKAQGNDLSRDEKFRVELVNAEAKLQKKYGDRIDDLEQWESDLEKFEKGLIALVGDSIEARELILEYKESRLASKEASLDRDSQYIDPNAPTGY